MANQTEQQVMCDELFDNIAADIKQGKLKDGDQLPPIRRFANENKIPIRTAYQIFIRLKEAGLIRTSHGAGTFVSLSPSSQTKKIPKSNEVYVILQNHPFLPFPMTRQLINELQSHQFVTTVIVEYDNLEANKNLVKMLEKRWRHTPPAAIVLEGRLDLIDELVLKEVDPCTPIVATFRHPKFIYPGWHSVQLDIAGAHYLAIQRLLSQGYTNIGVTLKKILPDPNNLYRDERSWVTNGLCVKGANRAVLDFGLCDVLSTVMFEKSKSWDEESVPNEVQEKMVLHAVEWIKQNRHVKAFVGLEPWLWYIKMAASILNLRIPDDLALVGIGKAPMWFRDGYPYLDWNLNKIATEIANIVIAFDTNPLGGTNRHVLIQPKWVDLSSWEKTSMAVLRNTQSNRQVIDLQVNNRTAGASLANVNV